MRVYSFLRYSDRPTGIHRYAREISKWTNAQLFYLENQVRFLPRLLGEAFNIIMNSSFFFPAWLRGLEADVYHAYSPVEAYSLILARKRPLVTTVHDVANWMPTPRVEDPIIHAYRVLVRLYEWVAIKSSDFIITVSNWMREVLQKCFQVPENKVRVIYHGLARNFRVLGRKEDVKRGLGIDGPMVLQVPGALTSDEAIDQVIRAMYEIRDTVPSLRNLSLHVIGYSREYRLRHFIELASSLSIGEFVFFHKYVPEEDLVKYYNAADVFIHPSIYEAFGFPPLEAMACGTPVIILNHSHSSEVFGDAAVMERFGDVEALAQSIVEVLTNNDLLKELTEEGLRRAKFFSWERAAQETLEVYEQVKGYHSM